MRTCGSSLSVMATVASPVVPADTLPGRVPKASFTLSPSSSTESLTLLKETVFSILPLLKVRLAGAPE